MGNETGMAGRDWQVLLIGGASGVGKTAVSYRVAERYGVGITEVDDFQVLLEAMTTPEQLPVCTFGEPIRILTSLRTP